MGKLTIKDGYKVCRECEAKKPISQFGYTKDSRFGKSYIDSACKSCRKIATYEWRAKNPQRNKDIGSRNRAKLKLEVISHYGKNGSAVCVGCGFTDIRALCIDHIFNNGAEERKSIKDKYFAGALFHRWLRNNNYPPGYQILCANCNLIKEIERRNGNNYTP